MDVVGIEEGANKKVELLSRKCWHENHGRQVAKKTMIEAMK